MSDPDDEALAPAFAEPPRDSNLPVRGAGGRLRNVLYAAALDATRKFGSLEEQVLLIAGQFQSRSARLVPLFLPGRDPDSRPDEFNRAGVEAQMLDLRRFDRTTLRRLMGIVCRHAIEIVHWNFYEPIKNPYLWALTVLAPGVRHYYTDHISRSGRDVVEGRGMKRAARRWALRRYDRIFCVSDYVYHRAERGVGLLPNLRRCIHFVNTDRFAPDSAVRDRLRAEMGASRSFLLLVVANLIAEKGVDVAIRALYGLPEEVVLWIVGAGPDRVELERLAGGLGLGHRVRFLGLQRDVSPFLQAADVFVCPSIWGEAAGLVNIEALACGLPVVASRVGGIPEIIAHGDTGYLFEPGDHQALAVPVRLLSGNPGQRIRMSLRARDVAVRSHSHAGLVSQHVLCYEDVGSR